ncbi:FAD-binding oxidoreductase [Arthrobacter sp. USHLN218]|uniref:FAD-binding oxidoreductase n=1 Tax=Arthrobacter sp. USHLN218 TaxID=3081232 RepID=UPI0030164D2F
MSTTPVDSTITGLVNPYEDLEAQLRGYTIKPADPAYDEARAVYNGMIDRRPAVIVRCCDAADVVACVRFARQHSLEVAVRGGGHSASGLGVWDGALVIDLSLMRSTTVDPANHEVRVDGGCLWRDVDHATVPFGMATPSGFVSSTGVGGLSLGGGIGYLSRRFGLSVDNLLSADVVLADGSLATADADHHPDLFWALRGGGGNFGVVTSFRFRCHDIGEHGVVIGGPVFYDLADTDAVMRWYRDYVPAQPGELNGWIGVTRIPAVPLFPEELHDRPSCVIVWCYTGSHADAERVLAPVREFGNPLLVGLQQMPFSAMQSMFDPLLPSDLQWYWKADFFTEITDEAIGIHSKYGGAIPTPLSNMHLYPISGAAQDVGPTDTAFAYRHGGWSGIVAGVDPDPANATAIADWVKAYWEELHPTSDGGAYVNFMMDEGPERIRASYRENFERLARVKAQYDPDNVFHINQNIPPAAD